MKLKDLIRKAKFTGQLFDNLNIILMSFTF